MAREDSVEKCVVCEQRPPLYTTGVVCETCLRDEENGTGRVTEYITDLHKLLLDVLEVIYDPHTRKKPLADRIRAVFGLRPGQRVSDRGVDAVRK